MQREYPYFPQGKTMSCQPAGANGPYVRLPYLHGGTFWHVCLRLRYKTGYAVKLPRQTGGYLNGNTGAQLMQTPENDDGRRGFPSVFSVFQQARLFWAERRRSKNAFPFCLGKHFCVILPAWCLGSTRLKSHHTKSPGLPCIPRLPGSYLRRGRIP